MRLMSLNSVLFIYLGLASSLALGGELVIQGVVTQWRPLVSFAQPGDVNRFKGLIGHDTETI